MNESKENIIYKLARKLSYDSKKTDGLPSIIEKYPYFGFAHFLLSGKMKYLNEDGKETQLQKTALYFSNPYWYNFLLIENEIKHILTVADAIIVGEQVTAKKEATSEITSQSEELFANGSGEIATEEQEIKEQQEITLPPEETNPINDAETEKSNLSRLLEQHASEFKKPAEDNIEIPVKSNPYHTVDYFASQGIKLESAEQNSDQVELKVKKFTDWLKQMKRSNPVPTDLGTDPETEHMVETIAQTSNETKDVITEAMAEVLLKQGKTEKAIQLYQKLSFLDPSKSAYFAAKINELND